MTFAVIIFRHSKPQHLFYFLLCLVLRGTAHLSKIDLTKLSKLQQVQSIDSLDTHVYLL